MTQRVDSAIVTTTRDDWSMTGTGLLPGRKLECSTAYIPDDGTPGVQLGFGSQTVRRDGTITFTETVSGVSGEAHRPGTLRSWLREPSTDQFGEPIMLDGIPAVSEERIV